ncbi:DNA polymerase III subunit alpha [Coralliovum pocilloporae]|uniref:DNA polymerase III subunit alpha n=1 Tax=Coralliovum pocilloporae TaxID=3066369 RepID=UPI0033071F06
MTADPGFIHLRVHSAYSLLEGALPLAKLVKLAVEQSMPALGIADTGNLFGALEFSEKASGEGLQPIIGCQLRVTFDQGDTDSGRPSGRTESDPILVLIAANEEGFNNLVRLVSRSYLMTEGLQESHVSLDQLRGLTDGLIALTGSTSGPVNRALLTGNRQKAEALLKELSSLFPGRLYVELQRHGMEEEVRTEAALLDMAYAMDLPIVATNEAFFPSKDDYEAHDALICISEGRVLIEDDRRRLTAEHYFKTAEEMAALFSDLPEALENTVEIARRCSFRPKTRAPILPRFTEDDGVTDGLAAEAAELRRQAEDGLRARIAVHGLAPDTTEEEYWERLNYELGIIESMKFPGYFLIVADFIKWAKSKSIPVGPGRGSGAGSLVAYSLTVTDLDPIRFALLFERFLNPERVSMPDFDVDFCQDRRDEVIAYVQQKYGLSQVAQIITYGTLQARVVLRDVGRVLQMPYGQVDRICKLVPSNPANPTPLPKALEEEPRLQAMRDEEPIVARLIEMGMKLEGLYRHASTHAAGIVIGDRSLEELVPLYRDPRSDMPVTQYNMKWVEQAGLVKFDFLGLKTLTVIDTAVQLLTKRGVEVDISTTPIDDKETYDLYSRAETVGVFQVESAGMRKALLDMKPDRFEDIIALVALYRPGPMENIPVFNARKHGYETPDYLHPKLEPILKETFGIIVYQEQVMQIAQVLSGYSLGEADLLRRAMGKKIKAEMDKQKARFVEGAVNLGTDQKDADHIFDLVAKFANYGFNKSHAAAYALVSYWTGYLKANYPVEFLAASMTLDMGNTDKLSEFRREAHRLGITVEPPSVNRSGVAFDVDKDEILYSLAAIKGVGKAAAEHIVDLRKDGPFKDLTDFARRINPRILNKRTLENLVCAGAFDTLNPNRAQIVGALELVMGLANQEAQNAASGQADIFGSDDSAPMLVLPMVIDWAPAERLQREHAAVGFYLSAHPLDEYRDVFDKLRVQLWADFQKSVKGGAPAGRLAGTVTARQERKTRTGNRMGIVQISDPTGQYEAVLFSEALNQFRDMLEPGQNVILLVGAEDRPEGINVRIQTVEPLERKANAVQKDMRIFIRDEAPLTSVQKYLQAAKGDGHVSLVLLGEGGQKEVEVRLKERYATSPQVASALKAVPGVVQVELA